MVHVRPGERTKNIDYFCDFLGEKKAKVKNCEITGNEDWTDKIVERNDWTMKYAPNSSFSCTDVDVGGVEK